MHIHHIHLMVLRQAKLRPQEFLEVTNCKSARTEEVPATSWGTFFAFGWRRPQQQWSDGQNIPCSVFQRHTDQIVTVEDEPLDIANVPSPLTGYWLG